MIQLAQNHIETIESIGECLRFDMPSNLPWVGQALDVCAEFLAQHGVSGPAAPVLVLRELLVNAMKHGNRREAWRTVHVSIEHLGDARFEVSVEDEGEGFDYQSVDMRIPESPPRISRKRGYALIHALSEHIAFAGGGNRITVVVRAA